MLVPVLVPVIVVSEKPAPSISPYMVEGDGLVLKLNAVDMNAFLTPLSFLE